jgi:hypothetical protein
MGIPTAEGYTPSGAASAKRGARGVAQHAAGGVETDLCANIPTHERPEKIAGQRDPPRIAPIVRLAIVVYLEADGGGAKATERAGGFRKRPRRHPHMPLRTGGLSTSPETMLGSDILRRVRKR